MVVSVGLKECFGRSARNRNRVEKSGTFVQCAL